jgi:hypothetical protein
MLVTGPDLVHSFELDDWFAKGSNMTQRRIYSASPYVSIRCLGKCQPQVLRQQLTLSSLPDNSLTHSLG